MKMYCTSASALLNLKVKGQSRGTGFSDTLPLPDRTMLLIAAAKLMATG